jgi:hypothetical protein
VIFLALNRKNRPILHTVDQKTLKFVTANSAVLELKDNKNIISKLDRLLIQELIEVTWLFIIARLIFIIVTTVVFAFSFSAFLRFRNKKTLLLTLGFGLFFVHGLISIPEILNHMYNLEFTDSIHLLIDAGALLLILLGVLQD